MEEHKESKNYSSLALKIGVGVLVYFVYVYFLSIKDNIGVFAAGGFFVLYSAEHIYKFLGRTDSTYKMLSGTIYQRLFSFGIPSLLILITGVVGNVI